MTVESRSFPVPRRASSIGMLLFLASLAMLFLAGMLGYVLMRVSGSEIPFGTLHLPRTLWLSTILMLAGSVTIHQAMGAIRRERHELFRTWLTATIVFATLFVIVQAPAMIKLYQQHVQTMKQWEEEKKTKVAVPLPRPSNSPDDERIPGMRSVPFYAMVVVLILIHALHVVGGMVSLGIVAYNGYQGRYDHENYAGVANCVLYWHFLDLVWIIMFTVIAAFG